MGSTGVSSKSGGSNAATGQASAAETPARSTGGRAAVLGAVGAVLAIAVIAGVVFWMKGSRDEAPRLNADTVTLVKFAGTPEYLKLPFDRQALYMKVLEDRQDNDELDKAYVAGKISEAELRNAKLESWLGGQLKRSEKYANLPAGPPRAQYISELLDRKEKPKLPVKPGAAAKPVSTAAPDGADVDDVKRDETMEKVRIDTWPADVRMQWETFNKAYRDQKDVREQAQQAREVAREKETATTQGGN